MSTAITTQPQDVPFLTPTDIQLIRNSIARAANDAEFDHFIKMATLRRLNPLVNQLALVIRNADNPAKRAAVIQTTIHGLRLIADRTKRYAPGRAATYTYDNNGNLLSATAYVMKYHVASKTWHEVSDTAFYAEYVQTYWDDKNKQRKVSGLWETHPHVMLAKCAEALALRRAFPEDTSGLYTDDEMGQMDNVPTYTVHNPATGEVIDSRPAPTPSRPQLNAPAKPSNGHGNGSAANPVSKVQRANLISHYAEIYGCDDDTALVGVHEIFTAKFGHDMDRASYTEGAAVMAHLLQLKQQAAAGQPS